MANPDLLAQIDAGIERHQPEPPTLARIRFCHACDTLWPCETLKVLRGMRVLVEAMLADGKLPNERSKWVREALTRAAKEME